MSTLTHIDFAMRSRSRTKSFVRTAFEHLLDVRGHQFRRHAPSPSLHGFDRFDVSKIEQHSLFDTSAPERQ